MIMIWVLKGKRSASNIELVFWSQLRRTFTDQVQMRIDQTTLYSALLKLKQVAVSYQQSHWDYNQYPIRSNQTLTSPKDCNLINDFQDFNKCKTSREFLKLRITFQAKSKTNTIAIDIEKNTSTFKSLSYIQDERWSFCEVTYA